MKKRLILSAAVLMGMATAASAQPSFVYEGIMNITPADPVAITADSSGAIYFVSFGGASIYEITDPVAETDTSGSFPATESGTLVATVSEAWETGRGLQGVAVDSTGNIYVAGDNGGGSPEGFVRKFDNSGTEDTTFSANSDAENLRAGGLALLSDDTIALTQFSGVNYYATADFDTAGYTNSTGGDSFAREVQYNPTDNVIYQTKNGNSEAVKVAGYYGGGTAAAGGYTWTADALIPDGAIDTAFGTATSHGSYDDDLRVFFDASNVSTDVKVRVYDVGTGGTNFSLLQTIDGTTTDGGGGGQPFPINAVSDAIYVAPFLYVATSTNGGSIYVFENENFTSVSDWSMF